MTTVVMNIPVSIDGTDYRPGVTYSLDDTLAAQWIANGWAGLPTAGPADPAAYIQFRADIQAVTGVNGLDTIATVALTVPQVVSFDVANEPHEWELISGTNASDGVSYQRPTDYSAGNQKVWRRRG